MSDAITPHCAAGPGLEYPISQDLAVRSSNPPAPSRKPHVTLVGLQPQESQALLGHSSIVQTMDTYSHLLVDLGGDAVYGLDEAFG
jgi:hypothetical protein